ncbi:MAG: hypothetical protein LBE85_12935 [Candidatus Accumulibacter sp.]|jgi:hypothetical protein|nr:hypothetical protein [Accumulibacter sp.]
MPALVSAQMTDSKRPEKETWILSPKERYPARFEAGAVVSVIKNPVASMTCARERNLVGFLAASCFADEMMRKERPGDDFAS